MKRTDECLKRRRSDLSCRYVLVRNECVYVPCYMCVYMLHLHFVFLHVAISSASSVVETDAH